MQDSNNATTTRAGGGTRREPVMDQTTMRTPDARFRAVIATPPKFRSPSLRIGLLHDSSWKTRFHFYLFPILVLAHVPLQTFLDFNAIYGTTTIGSLAWVAGSRQHQQQEEENAITVNPVTVRAIWGHDERVDDSTDGDAGASNVRSAVRSTDVGTNSSLSADFATSTIFTTSSKGLEHGADIVRDSAAYNR